MLVAYLLTLIFVFWSARAIRSLWQTRGGGKPRLTMGDEISTTGFALCAWYLALKIVGWG
jgi:hypothetical protein